jgi:hypothetical protein
MGRFLRFRNETNDLTDFRPALRVYNPRQEVLDGRYQPPPIIRS